MKKTEGPCFPALLAFLLCALLPAVAAGQDDDEPAASSEFEARVVLEDLAGEVTYRAVDAAPLQSLVEAGAAFARFEGLAPLEEAGRTAGASVASLGLAGGDRLRAVIQGGEGDVLDVEVRPGVVLALSIDSIRSIIHPSRIPDSVTESPAAGPPDEGDRLYLVAANGLDRAQGFVESFSAEGVAFFDERLGQRTYDWDRVAALFVAPLDEGGPGAAEGEDAAERVAVTLVGGGRISGTLVRIGPPEEGVQIRIGDGAAVQLPGSIVTEVSLDDGSFRFLGDVAPSERGSSSPFGDELGFVWPMRVDRNCRGGLLSVGGVVFDRGLGVHAPSRVGWDVAGEWSSLRLMCGMDDSGQSGARAGAVRFRVIGDGKTLWESEVLRTGVAAARPPVISLKGVKDLTLEVDPAGDFVLDRADWIRPMLLR
ncbi:NPCBM/NEW2 domain-containing protein [Planctomycetota bacterium]|nr:NPCBM/NEW2 domain-containing protein [Planctomycetota bacterium]